jgi:DNA-binding transcriptional regulator/RsmH inhibitor MraZ
MAKVSSVAVGSLYFGEFEKCTISDRVTLPVELRKPLSLEEGTSCVVARMSSDSFVVINKARWNDQVNEALDTRIKDRHSAVNVSEFETVKHVTIVAIGNCAEIWKPEKWDECLSKSSSSLWQIFDATRSPMLEATRLK